VIFKGEVVDEVGTVEPECAATNIFRAVRNDAVDFPAIVPSPPQLIFQLYTFSTGKRARVRGKNPLFSGSSYELQVSPLIRRVGHLLPLAWGRRDMENVDFESTSVWTG